jgi:hypothetical protein
LRTIAVHAQDLLAFRATIVILGVTALAAQGREVAVEKVEYRGWKDNLRLSNGDAELIVTLDVGPRILSYRLKDGKNVLKQYDDQMGQSGESEWMIRGGHRLWTAPEDLTRTYAPDNSPVSYKEVDPGVVRFTPAPDKENGIQKEIDVQLEPSGSGVTVVHRITNVGSGPVEMAPWSLTVMAPGGVEIIPLPPKKPHPGSPKNARSPADFAPNQQLVLWPFFDFKDPRWDLGSKFITLRQDARRGPTKLGLVHRVGWVGYLNEGNLFVKRFDYLEGKTYPDGGVNYETFTNQDMLEMESLGPAVRLGPGEKIEHTERWSLVGGVRAIRDEGDVEANVLPHVKSR